jgi:hypothetical protein
VDNILIRKGSALTLIIEPTNYISACRNVEKRSEEAPVWTKWKKLARTVSSLHRVNTSRRDKLELRDYMVTVVLETTELTGLREGLTSD